MAGRLSAGSPLFSSCSWSARPGVVQRKRRFPGDAGSRSVDAGQPCHQLKADLVLAAWSLRISAFSSACRPHWVGSSVSWPGGSGQPCSLKAEVPPRCHPHSRLEPRSAPLLTMGCKSQGSRGLLGCSDSLTQNQKRAVYSCSSVFQDTNRDPAKQEAPGEVWVAQGPLP